MNKSQKSLVLGALSSSAVSAMEEAAPEVLKSIGDDSFPCSFFAGFTRADDEGLHTIVITSLATWLRGSSSEEQKSRSDNYKDLTVSGLGQGAEYVRSLIEEVLNDDAKK